MSDQMQFLHSTILPQNCISQCVVMENKSNKRVDVLIVSQNRATISTISKYNQDAYFEPYQTLIFETPIHWMHVVDNFLYTYTETYDLIISSISTTLKRKSIISLKRTVGDDPTKLSLFAFSKSHKFLCLSSVGLEYCVVVNISDKEKPTKRVIFLDGISVLSLASSVLEDNFSVLTTKGNEKVYLELNPNSNNVVRFDNFPEDSIAIVSADSHDNCKVSNILVRSKSADFPNKFSQQFNSNITNFTRMENGIIMFKHEDNTLTIFHVDSKSLVEINEIPEITKFWILPNKVFVVTIQGVVSHFVAIPKLPRRGKISVSWTKLTHFDFKWNPIPTYFETHNDKCYAVTADGIAQITQVQKLPPHDPIAKFENPGEVRLFSIAGSSNIVVASNREGSHLIIGPKRMKSLEGETVELLRFGNNRIHITVNQIKDMKTNDKVNFMSRIVSVAVHGMRMFVAYEPNNISFFTNDFKTREDLNLSIDRISAIGVCDTFLSVATENTLLLFDMHTFTRLPRELPIVSPAVSMIFKKSGADIYLYVSFQNGSVARYPVSNSQGLMVNYSYIYFGKPFIRLFPLLLEEDSFLILDKKDLFLFKDNRISKTCFTGYDAVSCSYEFTGKDESQMDLMIFLLYGNEVYVHQLNHMFSGKHVYSTISEDKNFVSVAKNKSHCFALYNKLDPHVYYIKELSSLKDSQDIEGKGNCISIFNNNILVVNEKSLDLFTYNDEFNHINSFPFDEAPNHIGQIRDSLFVAAINNSLRVISIKGEKIKFKKAKYTGNDCITKLVVRNQFIWCLLGKGTIATLKYSDTKDKFEYVSKTEVHKEIIDMKVIDDLSVALSKESGYFVILRINSSVAHGIIHKDQIKVPEYDVMCSVNLYRPARCITMINQCFIYSFDDGTIGSLISYPFSHNYGYLEAFQADARKAYRQQIGFSQQNNNIITNERYIIDLDILDLYNRFPPESVGNFDQRDFYFPLIGKSRNQLVF